MVDKVIEEIIEEIKNYRQEQKKLAKDCASSFLAHIENGLYTYTVLDRKEMKIERLKIKVKMPVTYENICSSSFRNCSVEALEEKGFNFESICIRYEDNSFKNSIWEATIRR